MIEVRWNLPATLDTSYTKTRIEKASHEQGPYSHIAEIDLFDANGLPVNQFVDPNGNRSSWYIIRFFAPSTNRQTEFLVAYFPLTPREKRLVNYVEQWLPDIIIPDLTDDALSLAFRFAMNSFNIHPPETTFNIDNFPRNYEQFLVFGAQVNLAMLKYLRIGIRDFSYSDMGFSLNLDRGSKIAKAAEDIGKLWEGSISLAKWNFIPQGIGLGSMPLPVSVGASLNRGLLNVLDIMNQLSR